MADRCGLMLLGLFLLGCSRPESVRPEFRDLYQRLEPVDQVDGQEQDRGPTITISADGMPLGDFLRWIVDQTGISVLASAELDGLPVTLEARDQPVESVLAGVARRLGASVTGSGGSYYLGALRPEDRGVLVRRVPRLTAEELREAVDAMTSEHGRAAVYSDGLVVVADRVEVLSRIGDMLDRVAAAPADTWVVQLFLVSLSDRVAWDLGLDVSHLADVGYSLQSGETVRTLSDANAVLSGTLIAARESSDSSLIAQPLVLVADGEMARLHQGETLPVPQFTVSDQGTVTRTGFDYIQTGLTIDLGMRQTTRDLARLDLVVELSNVTGFVDSAPIVQRTRLQQAAHVASSGAYLVGALEQSQAERHNSGPGIPTAFGASSSESLVQVWARVYRIRGPAQE